MLLVFRVTPASPKSPIAAQPDGVATDYRVNTLLGQLKREHENRVQLDNRKKYLSVSYYNIRLQLLIIFIIETRYLSLFANLIRSI